MLMIILMRPIKISRERALELLEPLLEDEKALKVGRNLNAIAVFWRVRH
ncbi:hypothetical protein ACLB1Q_20835 [Escherichia coli]